LHNPCSAAAAALWHPASVEQSVISRLEALRPAIKREWDHLLRTEPALSPLANPDTLVFLMDETLDQLLQGVRTRPARTTPREAALLLTPLQRRCTCGLNPLLTYYATGELALRAVTAAPLGENFEPVLLVLHGIARREIDALCGVCCHRNTPGCLHRQGAMPAA
jgi:hypothetical protein